MLCKGNMNFKAGRKTGFEPQAFRRQASELRFCGWELNFLTLMDDA